MITREIICFCDLQLLRKALFSGITNAKDGEISLKNVTTKHSVKRISSRSFFKIVQSLKPHNGEVHLRAAAA